MDVRSVLAPLCAALRLVLAAAAVVALVPPCATLSGVVKPVSDVMSLLAPLLAADRLVRAPAADVDPVPPSTTARGSGTPDVVSALMISEPSQ